MSPQSSVIWIVAVMESVRMVYVPVTVDTRVKGVSLRCAMKPNVLRMESVIIPVEVASVTRDGMEDNVDSLDVQMTVVALIEVNVSRSQLQAKYQSTVKQLIKVIGNVDVSPVTLVLIVLNNLKQLVMMASTMIGVCFLIYKHFTLNRRFQ